MNLDSKQIQKLLHHRPPYLMVDEAIELTPHYIKSYKNFSEVAYIKEGHFPGTPVVPGAMLQELCTQSAGILMTHFFSPVRNYDSNSTRGWAIGVLNKVESAKYLGFAHPDQTVECKVTLIDNLDRYYRFKAEVKQNDKIIAKLRFCLAIVSDDQLPS